MKVKENFILRKVADDNIVVPIGEAADQIHGIIQLSETGALLWKWLEIDQTEDTLVKMLLEIYDVDETKAIKDVSEFISTIEKFGCVEE